MGAADYQVVFRSVKILYGLLQLLEWHVVHNRNEFPTRAKDLYSTIAVVNNTSELLMAME